MIIASSVIFAVLLGGLVFLLLPGARAARGALSTAAFLVLVGIVYGGAIESLGRAKPLWLEWRPMDKATVLSAVPIEDEAIYLWVVPAGSAEPANYVLPWSQKAAQELQDAMTQAETAGTGVSIMTGEDGQGEPMFYARPQAPLPVKDYSAQPPFAYVAPENQ